MIVFVETLAVNAALTAIAKVAAQRPLPLTYEGSPDYVGRARGYRSFWSGHASRTAAALTASAWTLRWRYGERGWPWVVAGVTTAAVGVERVAAGRHFPTDVAAGAAAGFVVGTLVPWMHLQRRGRVALTLIPARDSLAIAGAF